MNLERCHDQVAAPGSVGGRRTDRKSHLEQLLKTHHHAWRQSFFYVHVTETTRT